MTKRINNNLLVFGSSNGNNNEGQAIDRGDDAFQRQVTNQQLLEHFDDSQIIGSVEGYNDSEIVANMEG